MNNGLEDRVDVVIVCDGDRYMDGRTLIAVEVVKNDCMFVLMNAHADV